MVDVVMVVVEVVLVVEVIVLVVWANVDYDWSTYPPNVTPSEIRV